MGRIVVARDVDGKPVTADDLQVTGAMTIVMKEAIKPNLVQTMEGQPVLVHAGPFGNIAHGANSLVADRVAVKMADYIVTEAGFASDLGFQKFCDIVCRTGKLTPSAAVLVTTVRATKSHGGVAFAELSKPDADAIRRGAENLTQHVSIVKQYGLPCVVTINSFPTDTAEEVALVKELATKAGAETVVVHNGFGKGGEGAVDLANAVVTACEKPNTFKLLTPEGTGVVEQIEAIVKRVYGGAGIEMSEQALKDLETIEQLGLGKAAVCMAKSHLSLSHDAKLLNRPTGFVVPIRGLLASTGAGFVVALCGEMQRMPGLGKTPAFQRMDINEQGQTVGLT
jgi:formyltetrahydrofolate synthetase